MSKAKKKYERIDARAHILKICAKEWEYLTDTKQIKLRDIFTEEVLALAKEWGIHEEKKHV